MLSCVTILFSFALYLNHSPNFPEISCSFSTNPDRTVSQKLSAVMKPAFVRPNSIWGPIHPRPSDAFSAAGTFSAARKGGAESADSGTKAVAWDPKSNLAWKQGRGKQLVS